MLDEILDAIDRIDPSRTDDLVITRTVVEVRRASRAHQRTTEQAAVPAASGDGAELTGSRRDVLDAVAAGHNRPKEIEDFTGLKHRRVAELLKELVESGHLTQPKYGRYERAA